LHYFHPPLTFLPLFDKDITNLLLSVGKERNKADTHGYNEFREGNLIIKDLEEAKEKLIQKLVSLLKVYPRNKDLKRVVKRIIEHN